MTALEGSNGRLSASLEALAFKGSCKKANFVESPNLVGRGLPESNCNPCRRPQNLITQLKVLPRSRHATSALGHAWHPCQEDNGSWKCASGHVSAYPEFRYLCRINVLDHTDQAPQSVAGSMDSQSVAWVGLPWSPRVWGLCCGSSVLVDQRVTHMTC